MTSSLTSSRVKWPSRGLKDLYFFPRPIGLNSTGLFTDAEYMVRVYTGEYGSLILDSNVYITLYGDSDSSGEHLLTDSTSDTKFARNQVC